MNAINAEDGVFFANFNHRGGMRDKDGRVIQEPIPYQMSTIAWWQGNHIVLMSQNAEIKEENTEFSNIRHFFRVTVINEETEEILKEALGDETEPNDFTPREESPENPCWPFLGSPNGNGIAWFLVDHKKSLKGKTIEKITAWHVKASFDRDFWYMWATLKYDRNALRS